MVEAREGYAESIEECKEGFHGTAVSRQDAAMSRQQAAEI
jgi:hypothetical protein